MATSVSDWQKTTEMTLPSGNVINLRRVALLDLIAQGGVPDTLSGLAVELVAKSQVKLDAGQLRQYEQIVNLVVRAAAVSPPVTDQGGPDSLAVRDIDWVDRVQIFNWTNGAATALRPFRGDARGPAKPFNAS
ncbi:MAG: hypothetical protein FOGNACKC_02236 [Anaerolineae bacterium]|nr:hypothetical protein [Anaerolineae bacterium]